jgi:spermidine/putrescine transport system substrate-binding protein
MTDRGELDRLFDALVHSQSRREFVQRMGAISAVVGGSSLLAACGGIEGTADEQSTPQPAEEVNHPKTDFDQLNFANWPLYIDKKVLREFEREHDAKVRYTEEINDNEEFLGKVRQPLADGQDIKRDIIVLTDPVAARMVRLNYVQQLDKKNIPNAENLVESLRDPQWDPGRRYSLPYQSGMTIIGINRARVDSDVRSIEDLFRPEFEGRVSLFSDAREVVNWMLLRQGKDPQDASMDDILAAIEMAKEENDKGQIRRFTGNDYTQDLTRGNIWLCQAYSGDLIQLQADNPDIDFIIPEEGGTIWTDNMQIPVSSTNQYAAEVMMDHLYDPEVAATVAEYVNYVSPVAGAREVLLEREPELAENELIFPSDETLSKMHEYVNVDEEQEREMNEAMQAVVGA